MNVQLVVTKPESKRKTFPVRLPLLVGRSEEAKFRIQQDRVSRKHCEFFEQGGAVYLRDLGSTNGTFLNGELIETSAKVPLESGSVVRVGSLEFRVEFDVSLATTAVRHPPGEVPADDRTVGLAEAADSEHLRVEHAADEPAAEPEPEHESEAVAEVEDLLTAERAAPIDEPASAAPVSDDVPAAAPAADAPPVDDAFGFLADGADEQKQADDDQLGDFLKGLN